MSLVSALNNSLNSLQVIQKNISVISNNISNANTDGYTRKSAVQESVLLGADFGGARIAGYMRVTNDVVGRSWLDSLSDSGYAGTRSDYLAQIGQLFGTNIDNPVLSSAIENFASAWRELEAEPEDPTRQRTVVQRGKELAAEIRRLSAGVEEMDRSIRQDIEDTAVEINTILTNVKAINNQIATALGRNQPVGDYEDQRDLQIRKLATLMDVKTFDRGNGQIALYTGNGYSLLDGDARNFSFDGTDLVLTGSTTAVTSYLTGGKIEALYNLRYDGSPATASGDAGTEVIRKLRDQLDAVAAAFLDTATPGTFGYAYDNATLDAGASPAELDNDFFTGSGRTNIDIDGTLFNGTTALKKSAAGAVVLAMNDTTRTYSLDGLSISNVSYSGLVSNIIASLQQSGSITKEAAQIAEGQEVFYKERYNDDTGVNVDQELVQLQIMQNSYNAAARLLSVIDELYQTLTNIGR
ncbi:MAG: flagellar hook-associated protein FlgK [Alphaproteobacteria bacterium]|nr:flagellar hook-associated protein FlgK [Alphaproteobacteria bacterium]